MSFGEIVNILSASDSSRAPSSHGTRFAPGLDFSYRFRSASPFREPRKLGRPHTTPASLRLAQTYRSGRYQQAFVDAIATAQAPSLETIKHSLGDGLLMLRQGRNFVTPSIFVNLDKMHLRELKTANEKRQQTALAIPRQPPIPQRHERKTQTNIARSRSQSAASRLSYTHATNDASSSPANARRPSTMGAMVVEFLTKVENREKPTKRSYRPRSDYSLSNEVDDRCARNSDFPEIQIDGRPLSQTLRTGDGYMPREHCDVLGPYTCPDCIRTRCQNSHLRMCNVAVAANATDVYKLALIHERIPHLAMRELQRKIYDGEISDQVNAISRWKEIKHDAKINCEIEEDNASEVDVDAKEATTHTQEKARPKLKSRGSISSLMFETIAEASETPDTELKDGTQPENIMLKSMETESKGETDDGKKVTDGITTKGTLPPARLAVNSELEQPTTNRPGSAGRPARAKPKKKSPRRQLRVFNRGLIPSPNYFYSVSDLIERVQKSRRVKKKNSWEVEIVDLSKTAIPKDESSSRERKDDNKDEISSLSSQDSISHHKQDIMKFEPPIMYEKKSRYLGMRASSVGNLQIGASA